MSAEKATKYAEWIVANKDKKGTPEFDTVKKAYQQAKLAVDNPLKDYAPEPREETPAMDTILGSEVGNLGLGLANFSIGGPAQIGANIGDLAEDIGPWQVDTAGLDKGIEVTDYVRDKYAEQGKQAPQPYQRQQFGDKVNSVIDAIAESESRGRKARGAEGFNWLGAIGALPAGMLKFAPEGAAKVIPEILKKSPQLNRIAKSAGMAGTYGAGMPVLNADENFAEKKTEQVAFSAFVGALGSAGYQVTEASAPMVRKVWNTMFNQGKMAKEEAYRFVRHLAGKDADKFIAAAENVKGKVAGPSQPTMGDALAQQSRQLEKVTGKADTYGSHTIRTEDDIATVGNRLDTNSMQTNMDIKKVLGKHSKTPAQIKAMEDARTEMVKPLYAKDANKVIPLESNKTLVAQAVEQAQANKNKAMFGPEGKGIGGKAGALQDKGKMQTLQAEAANLAKNRVMPSGVPRVPSRYAPTAGTREQAGNAIDDISNIIAKRGTEAGTHNAIRKILQKAGIGADDTALTDFMSRPSFIKAIKTGKNLAAEQGVPFLKNVEKGITVGDLQVINRAIKQSIEAESKMIMPGVQGSITQAENDAMKKTALQLTDFLRRKSSGFRVAEDAYIKASDPINKAKVANAQIDSLFTKGNIDKKTPETFVNNIDEPKFYQDLTKGTKSSLEEVFPDDAAPRRKVLDLINDQTRKEALSGMSNSMLNEVDGQMVLSLPHILSRPVVITNAVLKKFGKDITPQVHAELEKVLASPALFKQVLQGGKTPVKSGLEKFLLQLTNAAAAQEVSREAGE